MNRRTSHFLVRVLFVACLCVRIGTAQRACSAQKLTDYCASVPSTAPPACVDCAKTFLVRSYQGSNRCLDYTPGKDGSPIFINECTASHPILVEELQNGKHQVRLHAGDQIIGIKKTFGFAPPRGAIAPQETTTEYPLELFDGRLGVEPALIDDVFALDGDSIILASSRTNSVSSPTLVAKVQNARGAMGSPVVLGQRLLADNEFWDFQTTGYYNSAADPTSGFIRIGYEGDPYCANPEMCTCRLFNVVNAAGEGTVVKVGTSIDLTDCPQLDVPEGVTIRGDRRGTQIAPELLSCYVVKSERKCDTSTNSAQTIEPMISLEDGANDIRITGLSLHGPSRAADSSQTEAIGLITAEKNRRNVIDHNDISDWPDQAVRVQGSDTREKDSTCDPASSNDPLLRPTSAFIARNFIHHNRKQNAGYGAESYWGADPFIFGNTFVSNRHAIAAGFGSSHTAYRAWNNLVLSTAPLQTFLGFIDYRTHDFDMHGMGESDGPFPSGFGGLGGRLHGYIAEHFFRHEPQQLRDSRGSVQLCRLPSQHLARKQRRCGQLDDLQLLLLRVGTGW